MFELNSRDFKKMKLYQDKISKERLLKSYKCLIFKVFSYISNQIQDKYITFYTINKTKDGFFM